MKTIYHRLTTWNSVKTIRVILGALILYSGVAERQVSGMILGGLFLVIALLTDGVCCGGTCSTPVNRETLNYEDQELAAKK